MENKRINQSLFEDFLMQLEYLALSAEEQIDTLESKNNNYKYIKDLLDVLATSKLAFVDGYCNLTKEKLEEFERIISQIITYPEKLTELAKEAKNLYYLKESGLYQEKEVEAQKNQAEAVIERFTIRLKQFTSGIDYSRNKSKIQKLKKYVEDIISLANNFEDYGIVKNIDFFQRVIEEIDLDDSERKEIISLALMNNLNYYQQHVTENEDGLEYYDYEEGKENEKDEISREQIEELLEEMLTEEEKTSENLNKSCHK